jgi:TPR repeat protein
LLTAGVAGVAALAILFAGGQGMQERPAESAPAISMSITPEMMKAAEAGEPEAQFSVAGSMLSDAELNLAYSTKALDFLQQAAEKGHSRAMLRLGLLYRQGVGAPQNYALAAKWIERAAQSGEPQALLEFGRLHREGIGMPRDMVKAYAWLNLAAAARDPVAARERAEVARLLTTAELQQAQTDSMAGSMRPKQAAEVITSNVSSNSPATPATPQAAAR